MTPQAIRYPTDLSLLNEARRFSEQIIDKLYPETDWTKKPRTYRVKARKDYLAIAKQKRPSGKQRRRGIKQQLQYLQRIPIEGKFGQGKNGYRLSYIRAKRADTSVAWINSIFLVMNLLILLRVFFVLCKTGAAMTPIVVAWVKDAFIGHRRVRQADRIVIREWVAA